jgi:uncharacterized membrane protein
MSQFSKKEAIKFGWQKMQQNFKFLLLVMILMMVVQGVQSGIGQLTQGDEGAMVVAAGLIGIVFWVINIVLALGMIKIALQIVDDNKPTFDDLLNNWDVIVKYFLTSIVYGLISFVAFIVGLLPAAILYGIMYATSGSPTTMQTIIIAAVGAIMALVVTIYFSIKYQFAQYFTVSEKQGPMTAIKSSAAITKGEVGNLFLFGLLVVLVNIAGALVLLIGLLATIPTTMIATAYVFRKLQGKGVPNPIPLPETKPAL